MVGGARLHHTSAVVVIEGRNGVSGRVGKLIGAGSGKQSFAVGVLRVIPGHGNERHFGFLGLRQPVYKRVVVVVIDRHQADGGQRGEIQIPKLSLFLISLAFLAVKIAKGSGFFAAFMP